MVRKLTTIREIKKVVPIKDADKIELCVIDGWVCVTKKGTFKEGDLGVYFEIDSILPVEERYSFLGEPHKYGEHTGYRIKTKKLKGKISQGLLLPLTYFPEIKNPEKGVDYSKLLNVKKYELELPPSLKANTLGKFPTHLIPKTDQERIQNLPDWFNSYKNIEFEATEKIDGMSITFYKRGNHFGACTRNLELKENDKDTIWKIAEEYKLKDKLKDYDNIAIQGELAGPGINKNRQKLNKHTFFVFDIYNIEEQRYFLSNDRIAFCEKMGLKHVPLIGYFKPFDIFNSMEELLAYSEGASELCDSQREGIVYKSLSLVDDNQISFKVINNKYLLKEK